jgi:hypothetical protein
VENSVTSRSIVAALVLLGVLPIAGGAHASPVPIEATAAAETCSKAAWPPRAAFARPSESVLCMRGEFTHATLRMVREIPRPDAIKSLVINSGRNPFWSYGRKALEERFNVRGILYMWEPRTPEEGTALASKQYNANVFFFDLTSQ